ncbi:hypothetical protein Zmor_018177 [Zophobas morio]|uniref:Fatty acid desaturase domain-containing protein n=1 Tax=Zophobas morio TaxID=2755281 RepID=A0AA38MCU0_9CUCU|nr:hypothetical protein Zmor_018177 [Zophobas morio]
MSSHGTAVGAHRLWAHRTFKAKLPLEIVLAVDQTLTFQTDIYEWVRDHRLHHKHSDTDYDPHNASRGFFYSHIGWLMCKKSPQLIQKGKEIDLSDLLQNRVVMFQRKYYWYIAPFIAFVIPAAVPWYFWNEAFVISWHVCSMLRYVYTLHATCSVNSAAHKWGTKPFDRNIRPVETMFVAHLSFGEGFHNYHHTFPWDYKAAELGNYFGNLNTAFIDLMAKIGWAYDLKWASPDMVMKRVLRTGDGSWNKSSIWGWGDKDMDEEDVKMVQDNWKTIAK